MFDTVNLVGEHTSSAFSAALRLNHLTKYPVLALILLYSSLFCPGTQTLVCVAEEQFLLLLMATIEFHFGEEPKSDPAHSDRFSSFCQTLFVHVFL